LEFEYQTPDIQFPREEKAWGIGEEFFDRMNRIFRMGRTAFLPHRIIFFFVSFASFVVSLFSFSSVALWEKIPPLKLQNRQKWIKNPIFGLKISKILSKTSFLEQFWILDSFFLLMGRLNLCLSAEFLVSVQI